MRTPCWTAAALAAALLAACGGGGEPAPPTAAPQRHRLEATPAAATPAATTLFDWAERRYPEFFPSHRQDQSFAPYVYRFYPETGIYMGVAEDQVYVMGGPFGGQPLRVGRVSDFLPSDPSVPAGTGNGCWDHDFMSEAGRHVIVESRSRIGNTVVSGMTQEFRVRGNGNFEGRSLLATDTTVTLKTAAGVATSVQRNTSWTERGPGFSVTQHGDEGSLTAGGFTTLFRTVFTPPWVDSQHALALGETVTESWTGTSTTQGRTGPLSGSRTIRFVSRETITVPAGTFAACRFEQSQPSTPTVMTTWIARGWGVPIRLVTSGSNSVTEAQSVVIDGRVVTSGAVD